MSTADTSEPKVQREIRESRYFHVAVAALAIAALLVTSQTTGFIRDLALLVAGLSTPYLLDWLFSLPPEFVARYTRLLLPVAASLILGYVVASLQAQRAVPVSVAPMPFPREDGLIANFASGPGGPARTAIGTQLSLFSDSVWNAKSKIWYERLDEPGTDGNGFLRIHYQLEPTSAIGPYVGLYTDLSLPPARPYDVSRFRRIGMRVRSAPSSTTVPIDVGLVLYSENISNPEYAFPHWQIPRQNLRGEWTDVIADFADFSRPSFVSFDVPFDPSRTYRLGLIISIERAEQVHGHLDIDDLRFQ